MIKPDPRRCDTCKRKFNFLLPYSPNKGFYCGDCEGKNNNLAVKPRLF